MKRILNIARGGFSGIYPENTNIACAKALTEGYSDGIYVDVHFTKDGKAIVMTDEILDTTTTGTGRVCDCTLEEILLLDAGVKFNDKYKSEKILTLKAVFELAKKFNIRLLINLKDKHLCMNHLTSEILNPIKEMHLEKYTIVVSDNLEILKYIKNTNEGIILSLFSNTMKWDIRDYRYVDMLCCEYGALTEESISAIHSISRKIAAIVNNNRNSLRLAYDSGVDMIVSDYPDLCNDLINGV